MIQISNLTVESFGPNAPPVEPSRPKKRQRKCLSCESCHRQKVRCDRQQPCARCIAGNRADSCSYQTPFDGQPTFNRVSALPSPNLSSFSQPSPPLSDSPSSTTSTVTKQPIVASWGKGRARFSGLTHWAQLCFQFEEAAPYLRGSSRDITALASRLKALSKSSYPQKQPRAFPFGDATTNPILFTQPKLSFLPSRELTEQLVENYLQTWELTHPLLILDDFQREFYEFWQAPEQVSDAWLTQLYLMLTLSCYSSSDISFNDVTGGHIGLAERCLDGAEITLLSRGRYVSKPDLHVVRALVMLALVKRIDLLDGEDGDGQWIFMGLITRVAMSLNLHIDPSSFPTMPQANAEARRRVWNTLLIHDAAVALAAGRAQLLRPEDLDKGSVFVSHSSIDESGQPSSSYQHLLAEALPILFFCTNKVNSPDPSLSDEEIAIYDSAIRDLLLKARSLLGIQRHMLGVFLGRCLCSLHQARASSPLRAGTALAEASTRAIQESTFAILRTQKALVERTSHQWLADFLSKDFGVIGIHMALGLRHHTFFDDITSPFSSYAAWQALKTNHQFFKMNILRSRHYFKVYRGYTVLIFALEALEKNQDIREAVVRAAVEIINTVESAVGEQQALAESVYESFELFADLEAPMPNILTPDPYDDVAVNFNGVNFEFDSFINNFIFDMG